MSLKDAFAGMAEAREPESPRAQAPKRLRAEAKHIGTPIYSAPAPLPLQGTAKSSHPEFEAVKVYVRKQTRKAAWRKWEDASGGDFSDLVQQLLEKYLGS